MTYKFGGFEFVESGYLDPVYLEPPYSFHLNTVYVDPQDPDDPLINSSNPSNGGNGVGAGAGGGAGAAFGVGAYNGAVGFAGSPLDTNSSQRWTATNMFWASDALWLVITSNWNNAGNPYYSRSLLYKLDSNAVFQYVDTGLEEYLSTFSIMSSQSSNKPLKTNTGVSLFFAGSNALPFGTSGNVLNTQFGLCRLEIKNTGAAEVSYVPHTAIPLTGSNQPYVNNGVIAVHDNIAYLDTKNSGNNVYNIGIFNGLEYIAGTFRPSTMSGFPVSMFQNNTASQYLHQENTASNIWSDISGKIKTLKQEFTDIKTFYTNATSNLDLRYTSLNHEGNHLFRIRVNSECDNGAQTCSYLDSTNTYHFYLLDNFNDALTYLDTWEIGANTDANTILAGTLQSSSAKINNDKDGHIVLYKSGKVYYYQAGTSNAIEITSQVPSAGGLKTNSAITPYGFGLFSHQGFLFGSTSNPTLIFIQPVPPI